MNLKNYLEESYVKSVVNNDKIKKNSNYIAPIITKLNCPICKTGKVIIVTNKNGKMFFKCSHKRCDWDGGFFYGDKNKIDNL